MSLVKSEDVIMRSAGRLRAV